MWTPHVASGANVPTANQNVILGGFINPYTIPHSEFWKLGQSQPGDVYRFCEVSVEQAQASRREIDSLCTPASIEAC